VILNEIEDVLEYCQVMCVENFGMGHNKCCQSQMQDIYDNTDVPPEHHKGHENARKNLPHPSKTMTMTIREQRPVQELCHQWKDVLFLMFFLKCYYLLHLK